MTKNKVFEQPLNHTNHNEELLNNFFEELLSIVSNPNTNGETIDKSDTNTDINTNVNTDINTNNNTNVEINDNSQIDINGKSGIKPIPINKNIPKHQKDTVCRLDFDDNCIKVGNQKYYIQKFISDTNIIINRLVILEDNYTLKQFIDKFLDLEKYRFKILSESLALYQDNDNNKYILKLFDCNDKIKPYYYFFNCGYIKPEETTSKIVSLLKLDQIIKAQAYFTFELKANIVENETEIKYEIFDEVMDLLYELPKKELQILFKEFIKNDTNYLATCALEGKFKKICLIDFEHKKRIYNV